MKFLLASLLIMSAGFSKAQTDLYARLLSFLSSELHENTKDKLIAVNVWSVNDKASRQLNQEFEKTCFAYGYAKLKGGEKGITGITFCIDKNTIEATITLKKDGISKLISVTLDNKELADAFAGRQPGSNIIFNASGNSVYENLKEGTVFDSIHNLITR